MGDQDPDRPLKVCQVAGCGNVFTTDADLVLHITNIHGTAGPAAAAPAARAKETHPSVERDCRPSEWTLFVRLLGDFFADSHITGDHNKSRQLIQCVP